MDFWPQRQSRQSTDADYPQLLIDYRDGFLASKTMFTACELGVFDLLLDKGEPMPATAIASHLGTNVDATDQLLTACVGLKLLKADMKNKEAYYSNTEVSAMYLGKKSPQSLYHMMMFHSQTVYPCVNFLPQAVREGDAQYERAFGTSSRDIFESVYRSEEDIVSFMHGMDGALKLCVKDVIQAFDLSEFRTVFDLGGGSAYAAKAFVSSYPGSTVTVMDLPKVVEMAKKHFVTSNDQHIFFLEGDFFNDTFPEADLFILSRIIHDWQHDKCLQLLRKVYQSCRPGGAVLIMETLLNEDKSGPVNSQLFSLIMLANAKGKERTRSEYTKLLTDAGFRDVQFRATGKMHDAILGRK